MAVVPSTSRTANAGAFAPADIVLATSGDTLVYSAGSQQELVLVNGTVLGGSAIVVTIDGSAGTTVPIVGGGDTTASVAAGYTISVPAGKSKVVMLDRIPAFLNGTVAITAATGAIVSASIITN
jgi:hypothetical protein